jgi:hypothetical protein
MQGCRLGGVLGVLGDLMESWCILAGLVSRKRTCKLVEPEIYEL